MLTSSQVNLPHVTETKTNGRNCNRSPISPDRDPIQHEVSLEIEKQSTWWKAFVGQVSIKLRVRSEGVIDGDGECNSAKYL